MVISEEQLKANSAPAVFRIMSAILERECEIDRDKEHFWVIGLDVKNVTKYIELVSLGTLTNALVHPREVFRLAIMKGVASIIVCHNHPSGDPTPSIEDGTITERLVEAGKILMIEVEDHVIIAESSYISLKAMNML